ncbi:aldose 1-epimerase [Novosphingobium resinovorum]|uniref:aldose 1-epimerase n=1 Tax=Novosphingobium TaxID=165696 RepID=UPI001B3C7FFA|nr:MULTISPECIES: aldose 1-epimerase [Novosphingobium]MBF7010050.1 aldose 1-epimerase [Novosphingobium sp. HR1a]WJM28070.1 aldose 1-epimerase [Novosphingobium resinovorum]
MIQLRSGSSEATLLPHLGGSIGSFAVGGKDILRPTPADAASPLDAACFPLVPYANRIADGRFSFAAKDYALPRNVAGFEHPIHGLGWIMPWMVKDEQADRAVLACMHATDAHWPWDWSATQTFVLERGALRVTLEVANRSDRPMPCGLGQHPYFVREPDAWVTFSAEGVWLSDARMIPSEAAPADTFGDFAGAAVPDPAVLTDNCWFGWQGEARLGSVSVTSPEAGFLHLYAPPGEDFLCLEPTTAMPDAFGRVSSGMTVLEPGETQALTMLVRA